MGRVRRPRIDERKASDRDTSHQRFTSEVLPRFLRRTPGVEGVVATLYFKCISTNDFDAAVRALYGEQAGSLSASTVSRLKEAWYEQYSSWGKRSLSAKECAHLWADGAYFNVRVEVEHSCTNGDSALVAPTPQSTGQLLARALRSATSIRTPSIEDRETSVAQNPRFLEKCR